MAEEEIASVFFEILANNLRFCSMCFRTERERKLVEAKCYTKCMLLHPLKWDAKSEQQLWPWLVCAPCERWARRALLVLDAISFATTARGWMRAAAAKNYDIPFFICRSAKNMTFGGQSLQQFWRHLRARTALRQTEVLRVSTEGGEAGDVDTIELENVTLPPAPPSPPHLQGNPDLENVVIIDDDDVTEIDPLQTIHDTAAMPPPDHSQAIFLNDNQILLHPNGNWLQVIPTCVLNTNGTENTLRGSELNINGVYSNTNYNQLHVNFSNNSQNLITNPSVFNNINEMNQVIISPNNVNSPIVSSPRVINRREPPILIRRASSKKGKRLNNSERTETVKLKKQEHSERTELETQAPTEPRPIVTNHRVDWEDKIPMDVISFMDATDPSCNL